VSCSSMTRRRAFGKPAEGAAARRQAGLPCWRSRDENPFFTFGFAEAAAVLARREMPRADAAFSLADTGDGERVAKR